MIERRTDLRVRRFKAGSIVFNEAASVFDCTVRNISDTGACLLVTSPLTVPAEFELMIEGERRPCAVAWRRPDRIGVKYQPFARFSPHQARKPRAGKPFEVGRYVDIPKARRFAP
ncbi:MAG TPA: PilZ domain-containing protein [Xanthobacteraceae bacterium]|nr:PilZ domain-containing protein [Xanthobacteraceae bacterium]